MSSVLIHAYLWALVIGTAGSKLKDYFKAMVKGKVGREQILKKS